MTKPQMIDAVLRLMAPESLAERRRLAAHLGARTPQQVAESLARWRAIANVKQSEVNKHCQTSGLPGMNR